jgi:hypothetical protein
VLQFLLAFSLLLFCCSGFYLVVIWIYLYLDYPLLTCLMFWWVVLI